MGESVFVFQYNDDMKVLFDARWILVENRFDGVSRYSHELAHALARQTGVEVAWLIHDKRQLEKLPRGDYVLANDPNNIVKEIFSLARVINRSGYSLVYSPFFMMGTFQKKYKLVLTIHDMIYFKHRTPPQWLPWHVRLGWRLFHASYLPMRWQLNKADAVATVSDTAKDELLAAHATRRPITTVSNAVSEHFVLNATTPHHLSMNIVYMGAFTPYKNVECLIDALARLPDMTLHLLSKMPPKRRMQLTSLMQRKGVLERVKIYDGATDEQYRAALAEARCSISASLIEGFGLPVLEAGAAGVPFIAADTPIFHEVGGDSVLYFDPHSPEQAAALIAKLADETLTNELIERGKRNAANFTWDNSAHVAKGIIENLD
jgi:glycosyltransferase involved in cell wall biosynthesis